jgi:hypothetical protein
MRVSALVLVVLASAVANPAGAQGPQRVVDKIAGAIVQLLPLADGSVVVVSTREVRRVGPAPAGATPWPSTVIASLGGRKADASLFNAAWASPRQWWLVRSEATDSSLASWNTQLAGPFDAMSAGAAPRGAVPQPRALVRGSSAFDAQALAAAADGSAWVAAYIPADGDAQVLQKFDGQGAVVPGFEANSARAVAHAGIARVIAGANAGWWVSGNAGVEPGFADYVLKIRDDGTADPAFGRSGKVGFPPEAAADGHALALAPQALLEDGKGTLWVLGKRERSSANAGPSALVASPSPWLRALSATTGARVEADEPSAESLAYLGPASDRPELEWIGFPAGATAPTACAATATARHGDAQHQLRCLQRGPQGWTPLGKPCQLGGAKVQDVALPARDGTRLLVGIRDQQDGHASLVACGN